MVGRKAPWCYSSYRKSAVFAWAKWPALSTGTACTSSTLAMKLSSMRKRQPSLCSRISIPSWKIRAEHFSWLIFNCSVGPSEMNSSPFELSNRTPPVGVRVKLSGTSWTMAGTVTVDIFFI
uniref:(northern house mosquito) hypothetical protein n=1 Tax=Culex pipiens TaxID=7175 RepID=A0A8D8H004_CULPI